MSKNTNRALRFRVWDKVAKTMIYPDKGYQGHFILDLNGNFHNLQNGSGGGEYVVMRHTGMKDKNKLDLWEYDWVKFNKEVMVVSPGSLDGEPDVQLQPACGTIYFNEGKWMIYPHDIELYKAKDVSVDGIGADLDRVA